LLVFVSLKGRLWLLDSTSKFGIGGHFVVGVFWRVVSVGSELLSLCSQNDTCVAILLNLLFTTLWSCMVLAAMISGPAGGGVQRPGYTAAPQTCPWSCSGVVAMISGTAGQCVSVPLPQRLLGLVPGPAR
jgi:hypothetical protein